MASKGAERDRQALRLRTAGATYDQIAEALGWKTRSSAFKAVERAVSKLSSDDLGTIRQLHRERLNELMFGLWPIARKGHLGAIGRVLQIMEREAKLIGVDAPEKHEHMLRHLDLSTLTDEQLARLAKGEDPARVLIGP